MRGFPDSSVGKESACNAGDLRLIPGLGRSAGEGIGYPFQYSGLENSRDYRVQGVTERELDTTEQLSLSHGMRIGVCPRVRPEGKLRWFANPLDGVVCRGHTQYPAFVPDTLFLFQALQNYGSWVS